MRCTPSTFRDLDPRVEAAVRDAVLAHTAQRATLNSPDTPSPPEDLELFYLWCERRVTEGAAGTLWRHPAAIRARMGLATTVLSALLVCTQQHLSPTVSGGEA